MWLATEGIAQPRRHVGLGHAASLALHAAVGGWLLMWPCLEFGPPPPASGAAVQIVVPVTGVEPQRETPNGKRGSVGNPGSPGTFQDLRRLEIVVLADPRREMIPVLRRYHGLLGFAPALRPRLLAEAFDAETGERLNTMQSLDAWLAFRIWEPEDWPEVSRLTNRSPDESVAYALFPLSFQEVILGEVRARAARQSCRGPVRKAVIAFSSSSPCGVRVESVEGEGCVETRWDTRTESL